MLKLEWCSGEWERWEDLQSAEEFTAVKSKTQDVLNRAKGYASEDAKGKGKGPQ